MKERMEVALDAVDPVWTYTKGWRGQVFNLVTADIKIVAYHVHFGRVCIKLQQNDHIRSFVKCIQAEWFIEHTQRHALVQLAALRLEYTSNTYIPLADYI